MKFHLQKKKMISKFQPNNETNKIKINLLKKKSLFLLSQTKKRPKKTHLTNTVEFMKLNGYRI